MTLQRHTSYVSSVAFDARGERLASGSGDKTVKPWVAMDGQQLDFGKANLTAAQGLDTDRWELLRQLGTQGIPSEIAEPD